MAKEDNVERYIEADKKRREEAGVPYKIAEALAKRQAEVNRKKGAKK